MSSVSDSRHRPVRRRPRRRPARSCRRDGRLRLGVDGRARGLSGRYESTYPYAPDGKMPGSGDNPIPDPLVWLAYVAAPRANSRSPQVSRCCPSATPSRTRGSRHRRQPVGRSASTRHRHRLVARGIRSTRRAVGTATAKEEYMAVMRALWANDDASFEGEFVSFEGMSRTRSQPTAPSRSRSAGTAVAAERAGRIGDGFFPAKGDMAELVDIVHDNGGRTRATPTPSR